MNDEIEQTLDNGKLETDFTFSFVDLSFVLLFAFVLLFFAALMLINPKKTEVNPDVKAEFMVTVTWDKESSDDVDTYVEGPSGSLVFFRRREDGLMHLDRDDLGKRNDVVRTNNGEANYDLNQEIVTIRGIVPGEYVANVHMYRKEDQGKANKKPTKVTVRLDKINPHSIIRIEEIILRNKGDEDTAFRFTVDNEGNIVETNDLKKLIASKRSQYQYQEGSTQEENDTPSLFE